MTTQKATTAAKSAPAEEIEWSIVTGENTKFAAQYPRMQWVIGNPQATGFMKSGGLFISKDQYPNFEAEGFTSSTLITRDGDEIEGYSAEFAKLAVIRSKDQWIQDDKGRNIPLLQSLIVVKGCPDLLCLSLRGASKALEFDKAFKQHIGQNVATANRTRPDTAKGLEPMALWFPVRVASSRTITSKDGKSSSKVTPPELYTPDTLDRAYVTTLWVGSENYKQFVSYFRETAAWEQSEIWEQRNGDDHATEFTGTGEAATDEQLQHLINLCLAKGFDEKEIMLGISNGSLTQFDQLTKDLARDVIEKLAAK